MVWDPIHLIASQVCVPLRYQTPHHLPPYINKAPCHKSRYINFALTGIEYLQEWKRNGNKLILWTCRAGEALSKAVEWCREQNFEFDAVNDNLPEIIEFYGHNSRKISCDYYIDDRMLLPENAKA